MGLLSALGRRGLRQLQSGEMFGDAVSEMKLYRGVTDGALSGHYWTRDPAYASRQALGNGATEGMAVMPANARFRRPYQTKNARESQMVEMPEIGGGYEWLRRLREQGYDAIVDDIGNQVYVFDDAALTPAFGRGV